MLGPAGVTIVVGEMQLSGTAFVMPCCQTTPVETVRNLNLSYHDLDAFVCQIARLIFFQGFAQIQRNGLVLALLLGFVYTHC